MFSTMSLFLYTLLVAGAVAHINTKVAEGDSQNTLQALQTPSAGLRAVHPKCAATYQDELSELQNSHADKGNYTYKHCNMIECKVSIFRVSTFPGFIHPNHQSHQVTNMDEYQIQHFLPKALQF